MGNESSSHLYNIGRCCATEEIEEVRRKEGVMEIDYGDNNESKVTPDF